MEFKGKHMKRSALTTVISILLIAVSLFGLAAAGFGIKDGLAIKKYKEDDAKAADVVGQLEEAIALLKENEQAYLDGIGAYSKGLKDYEAGQIAYNEGKAELSKGYMDYEAGKAALEEGRKQVAEGQAQIDANTQAYNEGKALLSKIEPLMPMLNKYIELRDNGIGAIPGMSSWEGFDSAQAWFVSVVRPLGARLGLTIPDDVTDFPAYMQQMVAEGQAKLKEYEDGLAALEAGKAQIAAGEAALREAEAMLAQGEKELAAGAQELAAGAAKLAAGKADLETFEGGMALVDEYTMTCFKNEPIYRHNGDMAVPGPEQRLGEDFDWYKYDENGELVTLRNGEPYLDLDKCLVVCTHFRQSVADHVADVTHELYMRLGLYIALIIAGVLGIIAGIMGLAGKGAAVTLGLITAALLIACNIFGLCTRYLGYTYPLKDGTYSGTLQLVALLVFAAAAIVFAVVTVSARNEAKKEAAAAAEL